MNDTLRLPKDLDPWEEVLDRRLELLHEAAQSDHPFKSRLARMMLSRIGHEVGAWRFLLPYQDDEDVLMALQRAHKGAQKEIKEMLSGDPDPEDPDSEEPT